MNRDVEYLIERAAIENLRYGYWYAILDKDAEALVALFTEDVELDYGFGNVLSGKQEARNFFSKLFSDEKLFKQVPRGANGIVEITGPDSGKGRWLVEAVTLPKDKEEAMLASVQYIEEYKKVDGAWKLCRMKNDYLYFEKISVSVRPMFRP